MRVDPSTGQISMLKPEYVTMSRRPGIGRFWYDLFGRSDVHSHDRVVVKGREMRPPRYYDKIFQLEAPSDFEAIQFGRWKKSRLGLDDCTKERLNVREACKQASLNRLVRPLT